MAGHFFLLHEAGTQLRKFACKRSVPAPLTLNLSKGEPLVVPLGKLGINSAHHERLFLSRLFARKY